MGVDAVLYRQISAGTGRRRPAYVSIEVVADPQDVLLDLLKRVRGRGRTPLLDRVDPLGELTVGAERMPQLLAELRCLAEVAGAPAEVDHVHLLARLVRRCAERRDAEIRFEGD
ncbi:hypothetical protein O7622_11255 [Micromonospora sp. WMMD1076]|uniref:hypothetical protein n=1 Tax=Micromonospora sp. WMMD1076 TaxID=3016103 RepID=UPI00249A226E|nr:hypothetical protein [Micromonospora sp. WMMD1076]WFF09087.1 hypothetical protein O7622_11255 [Micromonospora sp. WMMD1076]